MRRFGCLFFLVICSYACFGVSLLKPGTGTIAIDSGNKKTIKYWNLGLAFGAGLRSTDKVLGFIQGSYLNNSNEITVRPGGGLGFFLTGGRRINRYLQIQGEFGYQFSRVRPTFLNYSILFIRLQSTLMAVCSVPVGSSFQVELGFGPGFWMANRLVFIPSSSLTTPEPLVKFHFTNELGLSSQFGISHGDKRSRFFVGVQQNWVAFDLRKVEVDRRTVGISRDMKTIWNRLNGNGLWLKAGVCWYL